MHANSDRLCRQIVGYIMQDENVRQDETVLERRRI